MGCRENNVTDQKRADNFGKLGWRERNRREKLHLPRRGNMMVRIYLGQNRRIVGASRMGLDLDN